jgi:hypothetical protein
VFRDREEANNMKEKNKEMERFRIKGSSKVKKEKQRKTTDFEAVYIKKEHTRYGKNKPQIGSSFYFLLLFFFFS